MFCLNFDRFLFKVLTNYFISASSFFSTKKILTLPQKNFDKFLKCVKKTTQKFFFLQKAENVSQRISRFRLFRKKNCPKIFVAFFVKVENL